MCVGGGVREEGWRREGREWRDERREDRLSVREELGEEGER